MDLALAYLRMLLRSSLVCKGTKANKALTSNLVLVSAVLAKLTGMVMVMQKITKMPQVVYLKQRDAWQGSGESFMVELTWLEGY